MMDECRAAFHKWFENHKGDYTIYGPISFGFQAWQAAWNARNAGTPSDVREARQQLLDELLGQMALHYGEDSTQPIIMSKVYDFLHGGDKDQAALTIQGDASTRKDEGSTTTSQRDCAASPAPAVPVQAPIPRDNNATGNGDSTGYAESGRTEAKEP